MRITNLTNITIEAGTGIPNGERYLFGTATLTNNATLLAHLIFMAEEAFKIQTVGSFSVVLTLQPLSKSITSKAVLDGGNSLGLSFEDGLDLTLIWFEASDDAVINATTESFLKQAVKYTKAQGQHKEFLYSNYALPSQDAIASYGRRNQEYLRAVSKIYAPKQVFQRLVPGGFKLYRKDPICC
ncbi:MAG: hypothetical protein M1830_005468 [Pleopsidium flavum]|nr:MAG: hypothetical protein M1830_005468 [Pleopsidium flavum]